MAAEPLLPVYLLGGSDRPKVARALARLRARFHDESVERLSAESASAADAVAASNALGIFAAEEGLLVVVDAVERWQAPDLEALGKYLQDPAPGSVLALVAHEPPKGDALAELCARAGRVLRFDVPKPRDLPGWVQAQFGQRSVEVSHEVARALIELVGDDVVALASEIEKLADWAGGAALEARDVEALAVPTHETAAWALTDAWGERDAARLLQTCEWELERDKPFAIAARLAAHVGRVRAAEALAEEGLSTRDVARRLRMHEFAARKALGHAANYSREELDHAIVRLAELDLALKGASRLAGELELERALAELVPGPSKTESAVA